MATFGAKVIAQAAVLAVLLLSCGSSGGGGSGGEESGGGGSGGEVNTPATYLKVPVLGKTLNMDDGLLRPSCNQFYFDYGATKVGNDLKCAGISVKVEPSSDYSSYNWTVNFADGGSAFTGSEKNGDTKITINGTDYYCYLVESGKYIYSPTGQLNNYFTMPALLTKTQASKISEIKSDDIFFLATGQSICDDLY
jgi:hypothetical protein